VKEGEFVETFALATLGLEFATYSATRFSQEAPTRIVVAASP
jgi:hypothetical protein